MAITISQCYMVAVDGKLPWTVTSWDVIGGVRFVTLSLADPGFSRFASGSVHGVRGMKFLDAIKHRRCEATLAAMSPEQDDLFEEVPGAKSAVQQRKRARSEEADLPTVVEVELPAINDCDGDILSEGIRLKMIGATDLVAVVKVEMAVEVLAYIRTAARAEKAASENQQQSDESK